MRKGTQASTVADLAWKILAECRKAFIVLAPYGFGADAVIAGHQCTLNGDKQGRVFFKGAMCPGSLDLGIAAGKWGAW